MADNKTLIGRLNGRLHIIRGNHDTETRVRMYETCANVVDIVKWADMLNYKGYHFYLSHFPTLTGNLEKESLKQCTCNLFGHTHQPCCIKEGDMYVLNPGSCASGGSAGIIEVENEKISACRIIRQADLDEIR